MSARCSCPCRAAARVGATDRAGTGKGGRHDDGHERAQPASGGREPSVEHRSAAARFGRAPEPERPARASRTGRPSVRVADADGRCLDREDRRRSLCALHTHRRDGLQHAVGRFGGLGSTRSARALSRRDGRRGTILPAPGQARREPRGQPRSPRAHVRVSAAGLRGTATGSSTVGSASSRRSGNGCSRSSANSAESASAISLPAGEGCRRRRRRVWAGYRSGSWGPLPRSSSSASSSDSGSVSAAPPPRSPVTSPAFGWPPVSLPLPCRRRW